MVINCGNYYNEKSLNELCNALNEGKDVQIYIDCIGITRDTNESHKYYTKLKEIYGDKLKEYPDNIFNHSYVLKGKDNGN